MLAIKHIIVIDKDVNCVAEGGEEEYCRAEKGINFIALKGVGLYE